MTAVFSHFPIIKPQRLIYNFEYKPFLTDLKTVLIDLFYESIIQNENFNKELGRGEWVFVPVPLFPSKLRKRGYNQAEILAKELSKKFNFPAQLFPKPQVFSRETE